MEVGRSGIELCIIVFYWFINDLILFKIIFGEGVGIVFLFFLLVGLWMISLNELIIFF